jgi:hypothetical protein
MNNSNTDYQLKVWKLSNFTDLNVAVLDSDFVDNRDGNKHYVMNVWEISEEDTPRQVLLQLEGLKVLELTEELVTLDVSDSFIQDTLGELENSIINLCKPYIKKLGLHRRGKITYMSIINEPDEDFDESTLKLSLKCTDYDTNFYMGQKRVEKSNKFHHNNVKIILELIGIQIEIDDSEQKIIPDFRLRQVGMSKRQLPKRVKLSEYSFVESSSKSSDIEEPKQESPIKAKEEIKSSDNDSPLLDSPEPEHIIIDVQKEEDNQESPDDNLAEIDELDKALKDSDSDKKVEDNDSKNDSDEPIDALKLQESSDSSNSSDLGNLDSDSDMHIEDILAKKIEEELQSDKFNSNRSENDSPSEEDVQRESTPEPKPKSESGSGSGSELEDSSESDPEPVVEVESDSESSEEVLPPPKKTTKSKAKAKPKTKAKPAKKNNKKTTKTSKNTKGSKKNSETKPEKKIISIKGLNDLLDSDDLDDTDSEQDTEEMAEHVKRILNSQTKN